MFTHVAIIAGALSIAPLGPPADDGASPFDCAHAKSTARPGRTSPRGSYAFAVGSASDTDVLHYHLDIELDVGAEWIGGSNTMTIRSNVEGLTFFRFRLSDVFNLSALEVGGTAVSWSRVNSADIDVTLDRPYALDEEFELLVAYDGYPAAGGFGSIEFRTRAGAPEVWTLSEPWYAHTWWPAKDDSTDKTTADLWFTVDDAIVVASNGTLQGVDPVSGGRSRYRWKTDYQTADYLYCIGATNYVQFGDLWTYDGGSMPVDFYIYPEDNSSGNQNAWLLNLPMLDVFSARYGLYPFADEKYGMCQVGFGGGMEHQTMTSQGGFWESVTAHELGHQWFGDMITCATWHDIWLNEGFATYSEAIWFGEKPGGSMAGYHDRMEARRPSSVDDSVYVYDTSSVNRIFSTNFSYRKPAWVLHMLRHAVGDDVFFDIIAAYRAAFEYGSATTEDFRVVAESVYGGDLTWFIDEWIYDIGAPEYRYAWRTVTAGGQEYIELYVQQVQSASYPIFTMPIDAQMSGPGPDAVEVVWSDAAAEHFLFAAPGAVTSVALDPEVWILHTGINSTAFVPGPPKVVATMPEPGATVEASDGMEITVTFHKNVVATAADFSLTGASSGTSPFVFAYDPITFTATLTIATAPPGDDYTLMIGDGIVDVESGKALDGEVADSTSPTALPSGEGLPGGAAIIEFALASGTTPGDVDADGDVDFSDLLLLLADWGPCGDPCPADLTGDGDVGFQDLLLLLANWS